MNYSIQKLSNTNAHDIAEICDLLKHAYPPGISQYFIYNDRSFNAFLTANLARDDHFIYYITIQNVIIGFAQFKIVANTLFLTNLIVKSSYQNNKIGSELLKYGIDAARQCAPNIVAFELTAFVSNWALNWYLGFGMKVISTEYWYDLPETIHNTPTNNTYSEPLNFRYITDQYGFTQLFFNNAPVGYLINGKKLVIKKNFPYSRIHKLPRVFNGNNIELGCIIADTMFNHLLIDKSYQLRILISGLKFSYNHSASLTLDL